MKPYALFFAQNNFYTFSITHSQPLLLHHNTQSIICRRSNRQKYLYAINFFFNSRPHKYSLEACICICIYRYKCTVNYQIAIAQNAQSKCNRYIAMNFKYFVVAFWRVEKALIKCELLNKKKYILF